MVPWVLLHLHFLHEERKKTNNVIYLKTENTIYKKTCLSHINFRADLYISANKLLSTRLKIFEFEYFRTDLFLRTTAIPI